MEQDKYDGKNESTKGVEPAWVVRPDPDLQDLIPSFLHNRKCEILDIDEAIARKDFETIRRMAHPWKGICSPYGFVHLETLSRNLESSGDQENAALAASIASDIHAYLENVRVVYDN